MLSLCTITSSSPPCVPHCCHYVPHHCRCIHLVVIATCALSLLLHAPCHCCHVCLVIVAMFALSSLLPHVPCHCCHMHLIVFIMCASSSSPHLPCCCRSRHLVIVAVFIEHAIWLIRGIAGRCLCKYCTPSQNQLNINCQLYSGGMDDSDTKSKQGEGEGGDVGRQSSLSSLHHRCVGMPARCVQCARCDRSLPIMVKNHCVGNDAPPAPAPLGPA